MSRPTGDEGSPEYIEYRANLEDRWPGVHITGHEDAMPGQSCRAWASGLRFDGPVERGTAALIDAGFPVNPDGGEREMDTGETIRAATGVRENSGATVFFS